MTTEAEIVAPETPETGKKSRSTTKRNGAKPEVMGTLVEVPLRDLEIEPQREGVDINTLMVHAVQTGNIDTMERVMAIRRELKAEAAKEAFFVALAEFQRVMPVVPKTKRVKNKDGSHRFDYAPIEVIKEMAKPHLAANGLSVTTGSRVVDQRLIATATANHIGGHSETREFEVPITLSQFMSDQQSFAAASSIAERYAFRQVTGIVTAGDDNEQRITPNEARAARQPVTQPKETPTAQKAAAQKTNGTKRDLTPAASDEDAIDEKIAKGMWEAMKHAALSMADFTKRFPKLERLGQIRRGDESVVMSWIADPTKN